VIEEFWRTRADPPLGADVGSMPIETRGVQIWIFCDARQPAGTGSLVYFLDCRRHVKTDPVSERKWISFRMPLTLDPPRPGKEAGELTSQ
jgi:hypothetical protein